MKLPRQVVFRGFDPSRTIESVARDKANKFERFCGDLTSCRVDIEQLDRHRQQVRPFAARIHATLPGRELNVDRVQHEDVRVSVGQHNFS